jgi:ATP-binding cassette subfamily B protein
MSFADYDSCEQEAKASSAIASFARFLRPYLRPHLLSLAGLGVGLSVEMAFNAAFPLTLKFLIDDALLARSQWMLVLILAVLAAAGLCVSVVGLLYDRLYAHVSADILRDLRQNLFEHIQTLSLGFYRRTRTGELLARFSGDVVAVENAVTTVLPWGVLPLLEVVANTVLLFALNARLALVTLLLWPLALLWPRWFSGRAVAASYRKKEEEAAVLSVAQESIAAQPIVKAFNLVRLTAHWFGGRNERLCHTTTRVNFLSAMVERSAGITVLALHWFVVGAGAYLTFRGQMTIGTLAAFEAVFLALSYGITYVTQFVPTLVQAAGGINHINQLFAEQPNINDAPDAVDIPRLTGEIAFQDISFSYTGLQKHLQEINLRIPRGAYVAFVGRSGAGKSTVANLLLRFYDPTGGAVLVDGQDLRGVTQDSWRQQVAVVFQENVLFNMSLRENIRLGRPDATDAEVEAVARATEIHGFIESLPEGYDTSAGERGGQLSGGQCQRVAIARALIRNPAVLILDEATSALDHATEAAIARTLNKIAGERTVIAITHRLSSVTRADVLFVLEAGYLAESGAHAELLKSDGVYARLWRAQIAAESDSNTAGAGVIH